MLVELAIRNFAIIDSVRIQFGEELNVITGETGAGKSILLDALGAVLGERVSADLIRAGARSATIDATFSLAEVSLDAPLQALLRDLQIELDDDQLILSRDIQGSGRSTARLNGRPATAALLSQIGALLVDIHGQSDHLSLLRPGTQLDLLDRFAGAEPLRAEFAARFQTWKEALAALRSVQTGARDRIQRVDLLRFQVEEINSANLVPGEDDELVGERDRLAHAERLARDSAKAYELLSDEGNDEVIAAIPALRQIERLVGDIAEIDRSATSLAERFAELRLLLEDAAVELRVYHDRVEIDPARLAAIEERLTLVRHLKRKYGAEIPDILEFARGAEEELSLLTGADSDEGVLAERAAHAGEEAAEIAVQLSETRSKAAAILAIEVEAAISELNMGSASFSIVVERIEDPNGLPVPAANAHRLQSLLADSSGIDRVSFLIAPNPGEGLKPLNRIASGGETARLMLALKSVLSQADRTPTLVFDEIDVGVGGRSGAVVGEKLWQVAADHQVIAITHLPQIAAFAHNHFRIAKHEVEGRVASNVEELEDQARVDELAAMLDGMPITASSRQSAVEMLERAMAIKAAHAS